jgi:hypothetical protein
MSTACNGNTLRNFYSATSNLLQQTGRCLADVATCSGTKLKELKAVVASVRVLHYATVLASPVGRRRGGA